MKIFNIILGFFKLLWRFKFIVLIALAVLVVVKFTFVMESYRKMKFLNQTKIEIAKTANVVDKIKMISEFYTATFYQEIPISKIRKKTFSKDEFVLVAKGKIKAGFDLSQIKENDIVTKADTIFMKLPAVKIIDVITNPSDFETFYESGKWSHEEITELRKNAQQQLIDNAMKEGILEVAEKSGIRKMESLLIAFGFKFAVVEVDKCIR